MLDSRQGEKEKLDGNPKGIGWKGERERELERKRERAREEKRES